MEKMMALGMVGFAALFLGWFILTNHVAMEKCEAKFSRDTCVELLR